MRKKKQRKGKEWKRNERFIPSRPHFPNLLPTLPLPLPPPQCFISPLNPPWFALYRFIWWLVHVITLFDYSFLQRPFNNKRKIAMARGGEKGRKVMNHLAWQTVSRIVWWTNARGDRWVLSNKRRAATSGEEQSAFGVKQAVQWSARSEQRWSKSGTISSSSGKKNHV